MKIIAFRALTAAVCSEHPNGLLKCRFATPRPAGETTIPCDNSALNLCFESPSEHLVSSKNHQKTLAHVQAKTGLITHRHLLGQLINRDVLLRYLGAMFGVAWVFLNPLIMLAIFAYVFGQISRRTDHNRKPALPSGWCSTVA